MRPCILIPVLLALGTPVQAQEPMGEYKALAKILRHVMSLVTWPDPGTTRPLRLAVVGGYGFGTDLEVALGQGTVGGRPATVRFLTAAAYMESLGDYDAVFIDRGEEARLLTILPKVRNKAVLTLGYSEGLGRRGVMVNFYLEGGRIKFEVNPGRMKESGLAINSRVLSLARIVEG